jgi:hypothetical protein
VKFPVCYGTTSKRDVFAASSSCVHSHTLCLKEQRRWWQTQLYSSREVYSGSSLSTDLNFQSISGLYKSFTRMSLTEFEYLIRLIGKRISKKIHSGKPFLFKKGWHQHYVFWQVVIRTLASITLSWVHSILNTQPQSRTKKTDPQDGGVLRTWHGARPHLLRP